MVAGADAERVQRRRRAARAQMQVFIGDAALRRDERLRRAAAARLALEHFAQRLCFPAHLKKVRSCPSIVRQRAAPRWPRAPLVSHPADRARCRRQWRASRGAARAAAP